MHPIIQRLTMLGTGALLLACATPGARAPSLASVGAGAEQAYLIGRSYHMALRPELAMTYYRSALRNDPAHLNARNGLAVLFAEQGQLSRAIALWREMTASGSGSKHAFLFNNLGYGHLIAGEPARALAVLEQACLLDPLSSTAWQHLGDALARTGQHERAATMHRQAASLRGHDLRSDYAVAPVARVAALDSAVRKVAPAAGDWAQTDISQDAGGMFVLRRIEPAPAAWAPAAFIAQSSFAVPAVPAVSPRGPRPLLEISNGNGITGMARSVARQLGEGDPRVVRLSNHEGYGVRQTRIEYQPDFKVAAQQLAQRVGASQVVPAAKTGRSDLRLVLGRDLTKAAPVAVATLPKAPPKTS